MRCPEPFAPTSVTVSPSEGCTQACIYCYGTPVHRSSRRIDPSFCQAGLEWAASNATEQARSLSVFFHGAGEPTFVWELFARCANLVREVAREHGIAARAALCTAS